MIWCLSIIMSSSLAQQKADKVYRDFGLELEISNRTFFNDGIYSGQKNNYLSASIQPEYYLEWSGGEQSFKAVGFFRWDQHDNRRTHFDVRELYWQRVKGATEVSVGVKKVFWGKTESVHLVDIINQTDAVESFDGEQKLGEFMVHFSQFTKIGTFDVFVMPYFRKRVFPGREGRLRPGSEDGLVIDSRDFSFESNAEEWRPSLAFRWSHYVGVLDFGLSYFNGVGREPVINDLSTFNALYGTIQQAGLDAQLTTGAALWKVEAIYRQNEFQDILALAAGIEYTFGNVKNTGIDIGLLAEYLYDDRDNIALSGLQSDVFTGVRLAFNDTQDTQLLLGGIFDVERTTQLYFIEAERRIGSSFSGAVEARFFENVDPSEFTYVLRQDSFLQFSLTKYF